MYYLGPLFLTIVIECTVGWTLGYRDRASLSAIAAVNLITNPALNFLLVLNSLFHWMNLWPLVLFMETLVVFVEWALLCYALCDQRSKSNLFALSLMMNTTSFLVGLLIYRPSTT